MTIDLDKVVTGKTYPVGDAKESTPDKVGAPLAAINKYTLTLTKAERVANINKADPAVPGFTFSWTTTNPTAYPGFVHIGTPSVVCADGLIHGRYESPHLTAPPITPANDGTNDGTITWTTGQAVGADVKGCYVILPVEFKQEKFFTFHVLDISDL
jgi:hypothetical protein